MLIESSQDPAFIPALIRKLAYEPLQSIVDEPAIAKRLPALLERHWQSIELMRERAACNDGVIFFDVTDHDLEGYNKFIPYYLHPHCVYSVGLSKSSFRTKVSVGSNPWTTSKRPSASASERFARAPTGTPIRLRREMGTAGPSATISSSRPSSKARRPAARSLARFDGARTVTECPSARNSRATPATCSFTS